MHAVIEVKAVTSIPFAKFPGRALIVRTPLNCTHGIFLYVLYCILTDLMVDVCAEMST